MNAKQILSANCPECGNSVQFEPEQFGVLQTCPHCSETIQFGSNQNASQTGSRIKGYGIAILVAVVLFGSLAVIVPWIDKRQQTENDRRESAEIARREAERTSNRAEPTTVQAAPLNQAKSKPERQVPSQPEPQAAKPNGVHAWNTKDLEIRDNGNLAVAVRYMKATPDLRTGARMSPAADVAKTPWNYYGTVVRLTGTVGVVQDYPPQSEVATALQSREASEIVASCEDGTIIDLFCSRGSGSVRVGDVVTLYGYPIGITEVPNRIGGTFTHLVLVGNAFDKLSQ
jgi:hypothetical protein